MFGWLMQVQDFMPHGMCLNWRPDLMMLHIASDALIATAYFAIPFGIALFVRLRPDLNQQHKFLAVLFAVFITACGLTHVMDIVTLWHPLYELQGVMKAFTAAVSVATALALPFLLPQLLRIPSPRTLEAQVAAHKTTLAELEAVRAALAEQVSRTAGDLATTNRRFEAALGGSQVSVAEQDEALTFTWSYNPGLGVERSRVVGRTETDFLTPESAAQIQAVKRGVLDSGEPRRAELLAEVGERAGWFDMRIEPIVLEDGRPGIITTSTDITPLKRQQEHLRVIMRELNHRSKNLLTIVVSIARQTGKAFDLPEAFTTRLQERLASLASAHDVLARDQWRGADLRAVIEGQLEYQIDAFAGRISVDGPPCQLPAEAAHYVGMAVHELGSNAVKYGALSGEAGTVTVVWTVDAARTLTLTWREDGGPSLVAAAATSPASGGFGSTILRTLTPRAVNGTAVLDLAQTGVVWTLQAPLPEPTPALTGES